MRKNGVILLISLLCAAFFVSCAKSGTVQSEQGELVRSESHETVDRQMGDCYNKKNAKILTEDM